MTEYIELIKAVGLYIVLPISAFWSLAKWTSAAFGCDCCRCCNLEDDDE